ncbi:MAG: HlyC/CorC family transporter [Chlorobi bacterium]|nr:HlyC/CorC family transporter [Chlorobiota bacterium]
MDEITIILLALLFSAFFSGCEMAYISSNKLLIELNKKKFPFLGRIIERFVKNPSVFITTLLIGNNIALVVYGLQMAKLIEPRIRELDIVESDTLILLIQTIVSTIIILVTAEFLPKTLFRINPILILNIFAIPLLFFYIMFYPISKVTIYVSKIIMRLGIGVDIPKEKNELPFGKVDLDNLLSQHEKKDNESKDIPQEVKLLKNVIDFSKIKLRECIVPRTDIVAIDINADLNELKKTFVETGFSKILVYKENIDNIIGYVHVSQMFKKPKQLRNIVSPISVVPESMPANALLKQFTEENKSIALVVDEFGGTAGIITLEDILEEIFGEIDDEHDTTDLIEIKLNDREFKFSGRLEIDYINEKYNLNLPESDDYETLAGMILYFFQSIPKVNDEITVESFRIKILEATNSKIDLVKVTVLDTD